jgi:hypothetical protein
MDRRWAVPGYPRLAARIRGKSPRIHDKPASPLKHRGEAHYQSCNRQD